jgi:hypothetical protein
MPVHPWMSGWKPRSRAHREECREAHTTGGFSEDACGRRGDEYAGVMKGSLDEALAYSRERFQGGRRSSMERGGHAARRHDHKDECSGHVRSPGLPVLERGGRARPPTASRPPSMSMRSPARPLQTVSRSWAETAT